MNVLHFQLSDATTAQFNALGGYVRDFWCDTHRGNVDANMSWQRVHMVDMSPGTNSEYDTSFSLVGVLGPSTAYVPFVCAMFKFATGVGGRRGHGRTFQGGYGHTSQFVNGNWISGTQTRLDNVATDLKFYWVTNRTAVGNWALAVAPRNSPDDYILVDDIIASPRVTTMNTRKLFRGN